MKYNKRLSICRSPWSIGLVRLASSTTRKPQHLKKIPGSFASLVDKEIAKYNGLISGNRSRSLIPSVLRTTGLIFPRITKSHVTLVCYFVFFTNKLVLHQGTKGAVLYLKTAQVLLMQSVGRNRVFDISSLKAGVSRTRGGIPRCIPIQQRKLIRKGDVGVIRF